MQLNIDEIPEVPLSKKEKQRKYAREYMGRKYKENKEKYSRERLTNYYLKDNKMDMGLYSDYGTHASSILRVLTIVKKMEMIEPMKYIVDEINKLIAEASIENEVVCEIIE